MNKKKSSFLSWILVLLMIPAFQSCFNDDDDDYTFNDIPALATVHTLEDSNFYFKLEQLNKTFYPANIYSSSYNLVDGQRVWVYYDLLNDSTAGYDKTINVRFIQKILTKNVIQLNEENKDSIGDDSMIPISASITGDYLNITCYIPVSPTFTLVTLVNNTIDTDYSDDINYPEDSEKENYTILEFHCNKNSQNTNLGYETVFISFYLGDYAPSKTEKKGLVIRFHNNNMENNVYDYDIVENDGKTYDLRKLTGDTSKYDFYCD